MRCLARADGTAVASCRIPRFYACTAFPPPFYTESPLVCSVWPRGAQGPSSRDRDSERVPAPLRTANRPPRPAGGVRLLSRGRGNKSPPGQGGRAGGDELEPAARRTVANERLLEPLGYPSRISGGFDGSAERCELAAVRHRPPLHRRPPKVTRIGI